MSDTDIGEAEMLTAVITVCAGITVFSLIMLAFSRKAEEKDKIRNRLDRLSLEASDPYAIKEDGTDNHAARQIFHAVIGKLTAVITAVIPIKTDSSPAAERQKKALMQAGWAITSDEYMSLQLVLMAGTAAIGAILAVMRGKGIKDIAMYAIVGAFAAYAVLRYVCSSAGTSRKTAMEKQLPDMLDLLSVSVAAGLGFERAMLHIVETMDGPLIDEWAVAYREMSMGRTRKEALTLLAERCGIEDLTAVTGAIIQAGQLGIPVRNVLASQSAAIRRTRRNKVEEKAAKVSTKILIPMVLFIFPVLLIILLGPSLITVVEEFG